MAGQQNDRAITTCDDIEGSAAETVLAEPLRTSVRVEATRTWVTPVGELDLATAPVLDERLLEAQAQTEWVALDLRALTFMDCTGLRSVLAASLRAREDHHRFDVLCAPGQVRRILSLSGFDQLLEIVEPLTPTPTRQVTDAVA